MSDIQADFRLPAEILDGGFRMDPYNFGSTRLNPKPDPPLCFPTEFPYGICSSEIECDEDDFLTGLTRRLTRTSLDRTYKLTSARHHVEDGSLLSGSPQSTLNRVGSWSGRSIGSGDGSPNGPSLVSSSSITAPLDANSDPWNLIYQAAGEIARLKLNAGDGPYRNQCLPVAPRNFPQPIMPDIRFREATGDHVGKQQGYIMWKRRLVQQQLLQNLRNRVGFESGPFLESERRGRQVLAGPGQSAGWPSQRVENQSQYCRPNMKPAFLGASGKRERAGTGVFLPRSYGCYNGNSPSVSHKKTACYVALHAGKAVPAVNNSSEVHAQPQFTTDHDFLISRSRAAMLAQQMNFLPDGAINHELRLPQDWTY